MRRIAVGLVQSALTTFPACLGPQVALVDSLANPMWPLRCHAEPPAQDLPEAQRAPPATPSLAGVNPGAYSEGNSEPVEWLGPVLGRSEEMTYGIGLNRFSESTFWPRSIPGTPWNQDAAIN